MRLRGERRTRLITARAVLENYSIFIENCHKKTTARPRKRGRGAWNYERRTYRRQDVGDGRGAMRRSRCGAVTHDVCAREAASHHLRRGCWGNAASPVTVISPISCGATRGWCQDRARASALLGVPMKFRAVRSVHLPCLPAASRVEVGAGVVVVTRGGQQDHGSLRVKPRVGRIPQLRRDLFNHIPTLTRQMPVEKVSELILQR